MTFSSTNTLSSQRSYERLQVQADTLFDIGWLIRRLTWELREIFGSDRHESYHKIFRRLREDSEQWFAWEMLHAHTKSIHRIIDMQQMFPDRDMLVKKLREEREEQIKAFSEMMISKRWDLLKDDDNSWRKFARVMYGLRETTPETAAHFFALTDYIFMMTLVIKGKEDAYFNSSADEAIEEDQTPTSTNLAIIDVTAELKLFLRELWFDKNSANKQLYTPEWRDSFVKALLESAYGEEIIDDYTSTVYDRKDIIKGAIVGGMMVAGVFKENQSDLGIARMILYPNEALLPTDKESIENRKKKSKTMSTYIGKGRNGRTKIKIKHWVVDWVKNHKAQD